MAAVQVRTSPVQGVSSTRSSRTRMFRGRRRTAIRKCLAQIAILISQDERELARGLDLGYTAASVALGRGTATNNAFVRVQERLAACLLLYNGQE